MQYKKLHCAGIAAAFLAVVCSSAAADRRFVYVDATAPAGGNGSSWATAYNDLRRALEEMPVVVDGTIEYRIAQGRYAPAGPGGDRNALFRSPVSRGAPSLHIVGGFAGLTASHVAARDNLVARTVLTGDLNGDDGPGFSNRSDNSFAVLKLFASKSLYVSGITVTGASSNLESAVTFETYEPAGDSPFAGVSMFDCRIEDNWGRDHGALRLRSDRASVHSCVFRGNASLRGNGGAIRTWAIDPTRTMIVKCEFEQNEAAYGGAIFGPVTIAQCIFVANRADYQGGAVFGNGVVHASLFLNNAAESSGGAIAGSMFELLSNTLVGNSAPTGSALSTFNGGLDIYNSIFWANPAAPGAPALRFIESVDEVVVMACVLDGGKASVESTGVGRAYVEDPITDDPRFIRPQFSPDTSDDWRTWNYRLRFDSPAIARGLWSAWWDLDGQEFRMQAPGLSDIGCYFASSIRCRFDLSSAFGGEVDDEDFAIFLSAYDLTIAPPANPLADFNNDGLVDDADFSLFAAAYDALICP